MSLQDEFITKIEKLEPIKAGDMVLITVTDKYAFDQRDLWDAIKIYNKSHPELKGLNVPIIILDSSTIFKKTPDTLFRVWCDKCLMWGTPVQVEDDKCGNCNELHTRLFIEYPREALHT